MFDHQQKYHPFKQHSQYFQQVYSQSIVG